MAGLHLFGLLVGRLVLGVVVGHVLVGHGGVRRHGLLDALDGQAFADAHLEVFDLHVVVGEGLLEGLIVGEALLDLGELLLDLGVGHLDVALLGLVEDDLTLDQLVDEALLQVLLDGLALLRGEIDPESALVLLLGLHVHLVELRRLDGRPVDLGDVGLGLAGEVGDPGGSGADADGGSDSDDRLFVRFVHE
ncbi:hypothetical protein D3C72_893470 [compost metagenome]